MLKTTCLVYFREDLPGYDRNKPFEEISLNDFPGEAYQIVKHESLVIFIDDHQSGLPTKILKNRYGGKKMAV